MVVGVQSEHKEPIIPDPKASLFDDLGMRLESNNRSPKLPTATLITGVWLC